MGNAPDFYRLELELRESALNATSCGVSIADARRHDFPLVYVNDAFVHLTGYSREEVLGRNCRFLQGSHRDEAKIAQIHDALSRGRDLTVLMQNFRKDGRPFWNELTISPILGTAGSITHFVGIQTDATERETAKAVLLNVRDRLEHANAELRKLDNDKDRLLNIAAHDIRNPLSAVHSLIELARETDDPDTRNHLLGMSLETTDNAMVLLDDLLDISAIRAGALPMNPQTVEVDAYFSRVTANSRSIATSKGIEFVARTDLSTPRFMFDPKRINQVIANLVSNAVKFSEPGTRVTLGVSCSPECLEFEVADQGQGIPAGDLPKLFTEFGTTSARPTGNESSTGLGLSICKRIVELHSGEIAVVSELGRGTRFTVRLPAP